MKSTSRACRFVSIAGEVARLLDAPGPAVGRIAHAELVGDHVASVVLPSPGGP